jgi:hypothetical protein
LPRPLPDRTLVVRTAGLPVRLGGPRRAMTTVRASTRRPVRASRNCCTCAIRSGRVNRRRRSGMPVRRGTFPARPCTTTLASPSAPPTAASATAICSSADSTARGRWHGSSGWSSRQETSRSSSTLTASPDSEELCLRTAQSPKRPGRRASRTRFRI